MSGTDPGGGDETDDTEQQDAGGSASPPAKHRRRSSNLFGLLGLWGKPAASAEEAAGNDDVLRFIPQLLCDCILFLKEHGLATVGIFRVPGDHARVQEFKARYRAGQTGLVKGDADLSVHDVATMLKDCIRELPEPLVPFSVYRSFLRAARKYEDTGAPRRTLFSRHRRSGTGLQAALEGQQQVQQEADSAAEAGGGGFQDELAAKRASAVCEVALSLPRPQCQCLSMVLHLLFIISELSQQNRMTTQALAVVFAPTLMHVPDKVPPQTVLQQMPIAIAATKTLIENAGALPRPDPSLFHDGEARLAAPA